MSEKVPFFTPTDVFGLAGAEWKLQTGANPATTEQLAVALGSSGDAIAQQGYGKAASGSCVYICEKATGSLVLPKVGMVTTTGWHIDSISVAGSPTGWPTLTVNGHKHIAGNGHTAGSCRQYASTIKLPARFGVGDQIPSNGSVPVFELDDETELGMRGYNYTLACTHVDEQDGEGGHLAGDNHDGVETLQVDMTGHADPATDYTVASDWHVDSLGLSDQSNTAATKASVSLTKHISAEAAA